MNASLDRHGRFHPRNRLTLMLTAGLALSALAAPLAHADDGTRAAAKRPLVKVAHNKELNRTILVNRKGRSLYDLSAERKGKFICTDRVCLSFWTPLTVARGTRPTGLRSLRTIKRPDGKRQVTYRGRPLYTFNDDRRRGDVNGEGFEDVGVWHAVVFRKRS